VIARAAVLAAISAVGTARAEVSAPAPAPAAQQAAPDPAVERAGDANLESTANRRRVTFAAAVGGGLMVGFGIQDSVGRGGAVSLRVGHVATQRTVVTFEVAATVFLHRAAMTAPTQTNSDVDLLAGAQHYLNPSLWLRLAGGVGIYHGHKQTASGAPVDDVSLVGPAVLGGLGVDVLRYRSVVLDLELSTSAMVNADGVVVASSAGFGVQFL